MTPKASRRKARKRLSTTTARQKKEFTYRGYDVETLTNMPMFPEDGAEEYLIRLLPSRVRRSIARGLSEQNLKFRERVSRSKSNTIRTHRRDMPILPEFVGKTLAVHNGQHFVEIDVKPEMIGHYLAEFSITYHPVQHGRGGKGGKADMKFAPLK